jgi:hypothetical protein
MLRVTSVQYLAIALSLPADSAVHATVADSKKIYSSTCRCGASG